MSDSRMDAPSIILENGSSLSVGLPGDLLDLGLVSEEGLKNLADFVAFAEIILDGEPLDGWAVGNAIGGENGFDESVFDQGLSSEGEFGEVVVRGLVGFGKPVGEMGGGIRAEVLPPPGDGRASVR